MSMTPRERESLEVNSRRVVLAMAGLLVLLIATAFGFTLIFKDRIGVRFVPHRAFPAPAVVSNERSQRVALEARQRRLLAGAQSRLPIETAMQRIVARGPHAFDPVD